MKPKKGNQPLMTIQEVADFLKVHKETVRRWYRKEGLKGLKHGRTLRFLKEDVLEFLTLKQTVKRKA